MENKEISLDELMEENIKLKEENEKLKSYKEGANININNLNSENERLKEINKSLYLSMQSQNPIDFNSSPKEENKDIYSIDEMIDILSR